MGIVLYNEQRVKTEYETIHDDAMIDDTQIVVYPLVDPELVRMMEHTSRINVNYELFWFITMMSICFGGMGAIMRMVYTIKCKMGT